MGRITNSALIRHTGRKVMARLSLALWGGAVGLTALVLLSDSWDPARMRCLMGGIVLLTGAAIAASACRAIERAAETTHDDCIDLLLRALASTRRPTPAASQPRHHRPAA